MFGVDVSMPPEPSGLPAWAVLVLVVLVAYALVRFSRSA